jgi:hypothetical protein
MGQHHASQNHRPPVVLTVPGLDNSGPLHWQSLWERERGDCVRVDLGMWARPHRNSWVSRLNSAIAQIDAPVILAAHSLGCLAVAWWAALEQQPFGAPVAGALLVAPPDVDAAHADARLAGFGPAPKLLLPFPSILVASRDDPYVSIERAHSLAKYWGSHFVDAGELGHINTESGLGDWRDGQALLDQLVAGAGSVSRPAASSAAQFAALRDDPMPNYALER